MIIKRILDLEYGVEAWIDIFHRAIKLLFAL